MEVDIPLSKKKNQKKNNLVLGVRLQFWNSESEDYTFVAITTKSSFTKMDNICWVLSIGRIDIFWKIFELHWMAFQGLL